MGWPIPFVLATRRGSVREVYPSSRGSALIPFKRLAVSCFPTTRPTDLDRLLHERWADPNHPDFAGVAGDGDPATGGCSDQAEQMSTVVQTMNRFVEATSSHEGAEIAGQSGAEGGPVRWPCLSSPTCAHFVDALVRLVGFMPAPGACSPLWPLPGALPRLGRLIAR